MSVNYSRSRTVHIVHESPSLLDPYHGRSLLQRVWTLTSHQIFNNWLHIHLRKSERTIILHFIADHAHHSLTCAIDVSLLGCRPIDNLGLDIVDTIFLERWTTLLNILQEWLPVDMNFCSTVAQAADAQNGLRDVCHLKLVLFCGCSGLLPELSCSVSSEWLAIGSSKSDWFASLV